jgi:hypothetical protein
MGAECAGYRAADNLPALLRRLEPDRAVAAQALGNQEVHDGKRTFG